MDFVNALSKRLYWPLCRAYARHLDDQPADALLRLLCSLEFYRVYGFWPNLVKPRRFSEKVWSRQLHDRDPRLTLVSDKWRVRDYVARTVGEKLLVPLVWHGSTPEEIPFDELPGRFVIKANHGCDYNIIVKNGAQLDRVEVVARLKSWMSENFGQDAGLGIAWGYTNITPHIIIENFLGHCDDAPEDFKLFCFSGRVEFFKIDFDRFGDHATRYFNRELESLDLVEAGLTMRQGRIDIPENIAELIQVAESLSKGFDFIRVDLYNVDGKIYFGELTAYPGGISDRFEPCHYDTVLGDRWRSAAG